MAKFMEILFVALLAVALCSAEAPRSRTSRFQARRNRFLARQEAAEPAAVTPYPTADELKPEVPFDEAVATEEQQPDEVYGPPEEEAPVETDDVAAAEEEQAVADEEQAVAEEEEQPVGAEEEEAAPARLTARRTSSARRSSVRPAKLRKSDPARLQLQPQLVPQPLFYYVAQ
ncbi:fibrous sheath CABYR-binding protein-like [Calliphora vicina]|uniref:fibrous sheath CABYR-binding protein-like n=1 Tax=Calliphora vicina TaxID=7373 RepID=UPI00325AFA45